MRRMMIVGVIITIITVILASCQIEVKDVYYIDAQVTNAVAPQSGKKVVISNTSTHENMQSAYVEVGNEVLAFSSIDGCFASPNSTSYSPGEDVNCIIKFGDIDINEIVKYPYNPMLTDLPTSINPLNDVVINYDFGSNILCDYMKVIVDTGYSYYDKEHEATLFCDIKPELSNGTLTIMANTLKPGAVMKMTIVVSNSALINIENKSLGTGYDYFKVYDCKEYNININ